MEKGYGEDEKSFLGRGIHFPIEASALYGSFEESEYEENIKESIRLILSTSKGERVMRPDFGCGIKEYMFGAADYTTLSRIEEEVRDSLIRWEPRITEPYVKVRTSDGGRLDIEVSYTVRSTNNPYNLVFPFWFTEGYGIGAGEE